MFCCYTGLRYSDVAGLHAGNLHDWQGGRLLRLMMSKTRAGVSIYLTAAASAILDKYAGAERLHLLPVHPNQVMNKYLKRVCKLAGLTGAADLVSTEGGGIVRAAVPKCELVTMHTARHTFATQSLLRGMPVEVLQKVLGHKKIQTTRSFMRRLWRIFSTRRCGASGRARQRERIAKPRAAYAWPSLRQLKRLAGR